MIDKDVLRRRMATLQWRYADRDPAALALLEERISTAGAALGLITYSDLVRGVVFRLPNLQHGRPYEIHIHDWTGLDRFLIGDFLGYISTRSFQQAGFMASALADNGTEYKPSRHFFDWMRELDVLPDQHEETVLAFWAAQVNLAHTFYRRQARR